MEDLLMDALKVLFRIFTILPLLLVITLFMGKRAVGELPIFDFLVVITLGSVVGADIADPNISHIFTVISIFAIALLQKGVVKFKLASHKFNKLTTFEPTVVIQNGKMINKNIKDIGYTVDNILQMLREKDIFNITDVETAVIEENGKMSILKKPSATNATKEDLGIIPTTSNIALPVIVEGKIYSEILQQLKVDEGWLKKELQKQGVHDVKDVFFASLDYQLSLSYSLKNEYGLIVPKIQY